MDKNAIKKYAVWARRELIERVSQRGMIYGITAKDAGDPNAESVNGHLLSQAEKRQRQALIRNIRTKGYEQVMEEVAYTWFNRFAALRFMEVNGYLPSHIRVFTNDAGEFKPQILAEAIHLELDGLDMNKVYELESANKSEELFKYLLIVQCNALNSILPGMFQRIEDYTELLLPDYLLREGSVIERMVTTIPENDWTDQVQIIGWLYQYYNTEPKDKVFADLKKNIKITKENIPAATQLFTPDWIVHYMVENSLGRLWLEGHPNDTLKSEWKYYLDEAEQEPDVQAQLATIRKEYAALKPEEIRVIDPCMGSGHILCVLFDVLVRIYEDYGYTAREAAAKIVENNLWGLDIDERAAQLSYFAVMIKARQYDRRFFTRKVQPHVYAIQESNSIEPQCIEYFCKGNPEIKTAMDIVLADMYDAKNFGFILKVHNINYNILYERFEEIKEERIPNLYTVQVLEKLMPLVEISQALSQRYHVISTNPPYMGKNGMNDKLTGYIKKEYNDIKIDLYACCLRKALHQTLDKGFISMITMETWMFLSSLETLRKEILNSYTILCLNHMPYLGKGGTSLGISFGTSAFCIRKAPSTNYIANYMCTRYYETDDEGVPISYPVINERYGPKKSASFEAVPGGQIAYWASSKLLQAFKDGDDILKYVDSFQGIITGDNDRFLRLWYEVDQHKLALDYHSIKDVPIQEKYWIPYNKGGDFKKWYGNQDYVVNWTNGPDDKTRGKKAFESYYLREYVSWSYITSSTLATRYFPAGFLWDVHGSGIFDKSDMLYYLQGLIGSRVGMALLKVINSTISFQVENIVQIPVIVDKELKPRIDEKVKRNVEIAKEDWDSDEVSWHFLRSPLLTYNTSGLIADAISAWSEHLRRNADETAMNEKAITDLFAHVYGISDEELSYVEDRDVTVKLPDTTRDIKYFISYAVGCIMGRYSLDKPGLVFAGGEWDENAYRSFVPDKDGILPICDDEYFEDDIVGSFVNFVETAFGYAHLEENLQFIANALGGHGASRDIIRRYFINDFYNDHCAMYSITGSGRRPIYWLFDSGKKNGFKCLIYMHRYQPDTIARIRTDYVHEQQSRYRTAIADLEQRINGASASERVKLSKQLAKLQAQAEEIRIYEEKIHHLADQMIKIDLDDGVKHNYEIFQDVLAKIK